MTKITRGNPPNLKNGLFREDAYWDFKAGCPSARREVAALFWTKNRAALSG